MRFSLLISLALLALVLACSGGAKTADESPTATPRPSQAAATASPTTAPASPAALATDEPTKAPAATSAPQPTATSVPATQAAPAPTAPPAPTSPPVPAGVPAPIKAYTFPSQLTVAAGSTVVWTNYDTVPHDVTGSDDSWSSGLLGEGQSYSHTFSQPGEYAYTCRVHPYMSAVLIVE